jgi:hypothetical protein
MNILLSNNLFAQDSDYTKGRKLLFKQAQEFYQAESLKWATENNIDPEIIEKKLPKKIRDLLENDPKYGKKPLILPNELTQNQKKEMFVFIIRNHLKYKHSPSNKVTNSTTQVINAVKKTDVKVVNVVAKTVSPKSITPKTEKKKSFFQKYKFLLIALVLIILYIKFKK